MVFNSPPHKPAISYQHTAVSENKKGFRLMTESCAYPTAYPVLAVAMSHEL
jgi:hypothetical protein